MYDPKSPWHDKRVRLAANHAINRQAINEAETLGYSKLLGGIIPRRRMTLPCRLEPYAYDPKKAKQLLKEAGYANGFDAGEYSCDAVYAGVVEAMVNDLGAIGIRAKVQPLERAAIQAAQKEKKVKNLTRPGQWGLWERRHAYRGVSCIVRGRSRSSKTPKSISGMSSRPSNATARSVRRCCTRSSRRCMMKAYVMPDLGTGLPCAPRATGGGVRAGTDSRVCLLRPYEEYA